MFTNFAKKVREIVPVVRSTTNANMLRQEVGIRFDDKLYLLIGEVITHENSISMNWNIQLDHTISNIMTVELSISETYNIEGMCTFLRLMFRVGADS